MLCPSNYIGIIRYIYIYKIILSILGEFGAILNAWMCQGSSRRLKRIA